MKTRCPHCLHEHEIPPATLNKVVDCPACRRRHVARRVPAGTAPRRRPLGSALLILVILLLAGGAAFAYLCQRRGETPRQLVRHWLDSLRPAPAAPADPAASPPAAPAPKAEELAPEDTAMDELAEEDPPAFALELLPPPGLESAASPAAPDPLAWLLADKSRWPRELSLARAERFQVLEAGALVGEATLPEGGRVRLLEIKDGLVVVSHLGDVRELPLDATDLLSRARADIGRHEALLRFAAADRAERARRAAAARVAARPPAPSGPRQLRSTDLPPYREGPFVHPGALHTAEDLKRMAAKVRSRGQPWLDTWDLLERSPFGPGWRPRPVQQIIRGVPGNNYTPSQRDANVAYQCAIRYHVTGDEAFANTALDILNAWARTMTKGVGGNSNFALGAGIVGYEFACAGELLRDYHGWKPGEFDAYKRFLQLFLGGNRDFLRRHNGTCGSHYRLNWDTCNLLSMISIAVVCDDQETFDDAISYFLDGVGNGCIDRAVWYIHPDGLGQPEEMGRDQPHNLTGLDWLGLFCQVAWNQGVDLYGYDNNRLLRALEYVARYNLGDDDISYVPHRNCSLKQTEAVPSTQHRGGLFTMFEMPYNHYVNRRGLAAPWIEQAALRLRPNGGPHGGHPSLYDRFGYGSLTYALDPVEQGAPPSGLRALWGEHGLALSWWGTARAVRYEIKRSTVAGGPWSIVGTVDAADKRAAFEDRDVAADLPYHYVVTSIDNRGRSLSSPEFTARRGLLARYPLHGDLADSVGGPEAEHSTDKPVYTGGPRGGKVLVFDGENDYLRLPRDVAHARDITLAAWVYWEGGGDEHRVFDIGTDIAKFMSLTPRARDGQMRFTLTTTRGTESTGVLEAPALALRRWTHVAVTITGGVGTLYVDGKPAATAPMPAAPLFTQNRCYLGKSQWPADPLFKGRIADFRVYNHALAPAAVQELSKNTPGAPTSLFGTP